jgi:hypothetical protein
MGSGWLALDLLLLRRSQILILTVAVKNVPSGSVGANGRNLSPSACELVSPIVGYGFLLEREAALVSKSELGRQNAVGVVNTLQFPQLAQRLGRSRVRFSQLYAFFVMPDQGDRPAVARCKSTCAAFSAHRGY